jgi:hypothetical protein
MTTPGASSKAWPKPIVAVISEIYPYMTTSLFATWKLGGVFAPLDYHVPCDILEHMLHNIAYLCLDSTESLIHNIVKGTFFLFCFFVSR